MSVTVSMKINPKQAGKMYMELTAAKERIEQLEDAAKEAILILRQLPNDKCWSYFEDVSKAKDVLYSTVEEPQEEDTNAPK